MCFSATSSLVASGVLGAVGTSTLTKAKPRQRPIAFVPIFFAIQQLCEGLVWITIHEGKPSLIAAYGFLFFAHVFWQTYIPFAMYVMERRKIFLWLMGFGIINSIVSLVGLIMYPLNIEVIGNSLSYGARFPFQTPLGWMYLLIVFGALVVSRDHFFKWTAIILLCLAGVAGYFYYYTYASVWCFFAAVASIIIDIHLRRANK